MGSSSSVTKRSPGLGRVSPGALRDQRRIAGHRRRSEAKAAHRRGPRPRPLAARAPRGGADRRPLRRRLVCARVVQALGTLRVLDAAAPRRRWRRWRAATSPTEATRRPARCWCSSPTDCCGGALSAHAQAADERRALRAGRGLAGPAGVAAADRGLVRRRWLPDWTGALARLAEAVIARGADRDPRGARDRRLV